jgi:hypothetical protein
MKVRWMEVILWTDGDWIWGMRRESEKGWRLLTIFFSKNHLFACIADGCGWGAAPAKSAKHSTEEFLAFVDFNFNKVSTVEEASSLLLNSILVAHDSTTKVCALHNLV